jgi:hypothetical protein
MKQKILVSVIMFAAMGGCGGDNASSTVGTVGAAGVTSVAGSLSTGGSSAIGESPSTSGTAGAAGVAGTTSVSVTAGSTPSVGGTSAVTPVAGTTSTAGIPSTGGSTGGTSGDPSAEQVAVPLNLRGKTLKSEPLYTPYVFDPDSDTASFPELVDGCDDCVWESSYTWQVDTLDINYSFEVPAMSRKYEYHEVLHLTFITSDHGVLSGFGTERWLESGELISVTPYDIPQSSFTLQ